MTDTPTPLLPAWLYEMAERLRTQDNRGTANPVFCVQEQERIESLDDSGEYDWRDADWYVASEDEAARLDKAVDDFDEDATKGWTKCHYRTEWRTVRVCLTEKGAQDYLDCDGHNLCRNGPPRIYVESIYRCQEMIQLREWIMSLTPPPKEQQT